jgi:CRP/FNR family cyclic AMP-dependent transcriptional regulator
MAGLHHMKTQRQTTFDAKLFLDSAGLSRKAIEFRRKQIIYTQGDLSTTVLYIQQGGVKLCVVNETGKEAVLAILGRGDFFGEGCLAGQAKRMGTAVAIMPTTAVAIDKFEMVRLLHVELSAPMQKSP